MAIIKSGKYRKGSEELEIITFEDFPNQCQPRPRQRGDKNHVWSLQFRGYPVSPQGGDSYRIYIRGMCLGWDSGVLGKGVIVIDSQGHLFIHKLEELENDPELQPITDDANDKKVDLIQYIKGFSSMLTYEHAKALSCFTEKRFPDAAEKAGVVFKRRPDQETEEQPFVVYLISMHKGQEASARGLHGVEWVMLAELLVAEHKLHNLRLQQEFKHG